jgi:deoxyribodipyrimidine photo-lyase
LPWQLGAKLFLEDLIDADAASNTLSWRWVAGLHTVGKNYVARADNIRRFTDDRFFPVSQLNEQPSSMVESSRFERLPELPAFTKQVLPTGRIGLLVHSEDLSIETTGLGRERFESIAFFRNCTPRRSESVRAFDAVAEADSITRLSRHFRTNVRCIDNLDQLGGWGHELDGIVVVEPWQGWLRDELHRWFQSTAKPIWFARRVYDLSLTPIATRGFFDFSKGLSELLESFAGKDLSQDFMMKLQKWN